MSQRPQQIAPAEERREEIFLARYALMRRWALRLTEGDRGRAEDLVQDAYIQFMVSRPDLERIQNLDGYLYQMLSNLNISHLRRATRLQNRTLSVLEYDSAELGLRHVADPRARISALEELRACCRYACARKETSKAGSVLILRFFHGYYPREIAGVMRATREAVEERLRVARSEARQFLKDPGSLRFMNDAPREAAAVAFESQGNETATEDLLAELRRAVFSSRQGDCPPVEDLASMYRVDAAAGMKTDSLAHLVSCPRCMDEVNDLLGLAPLSERVPVDMLGGDTRRGGGDDVGGGGDDEGGDAGGGSSGEWPSEDEVRRCRRRARDLFEHEPRELSVAVNGHLLAAQKVGAARCEQTLSVPPGEPVDFVEVFSEQDVRLLFLSVGGQQSAASVSDRLSARVSLSDERTLEAVLSFENAWPTVRVIYDDPTLESAPAAEAASTPLAAAARVARTLPERLAGILSFGKFMLRPAALTAALACVVVAALVLTRVFVPAVSAAELLKRSAAAEERAGADAALVLHRTFVLEEVSAARGETLSRRRVEVWQSAARGLRLRRVFDQQNNVAACELVSSAGGVTVYRRGSAPEERQGTPGAAALLEAGEAWRLDPSARTFSALVPRVEGVTVEDGLGSYVLSYRGDGAGTLASATLRLSKSDLRATGQTLVVTGPDGAAREYRFIESAYERLSPSKVEEKVFEPEPELSGSSGAGVSGVPVAVAERGGDVSAPNSDGASAAVASPELEVEVTHLLNQIKANLGEQVSLARTTGGQLRVEALVETEGRKTEILRALGPVRKHPAVIVDVATVAEKMRLGAGGAGDQTVQEVEVRAGGMPAAEDLRRYFSSRLVGDERVEEESRRLAVRAMARSRQALRHASALRRLVERFSPDEIRALDAAARDKWLAMIRQHAQAVGREVGALNGELRPVFPHANAQGAGAGSFGGDASDARVAAARLLRLSYETDEAVRSAFTLSADAGGASRVKSAQFWRALAESRRLASAIHAAYAR